jgi:hypothetical protein
MLEQRPDLGAVARRQGAADGGLERRRRFFFLTPVGRRDFFLVVLLYGCFFLDSFRRRDSYRFCFAFPGFFSYLPGVFFRLHFDRCDGLYLAR